MINKKKTPYGFIPLQQIGIEWLRII